MKLPHAPRGFSLKRWLMALIFGLGFASVTPPVLADGKVFAPTLVPQQIEMPDQRALLAWQNGVETLVIESAFIGKGTDFAWVVPLPSKPEVFPATSGTLPSAVALMQPVITRPYEGAGFIAIATGSMGLIALFFGWSLVGMILRGLLAIAGIAVIAAVLTAFTQSEALGWSIFIIGSAGLAWFARNWLRSEISMFEVLATLLGLALLAAILIPTVAAVRPAKAAPFPVEPITMEQHLIGDYDVAVISGNEGNGVVTWLETHGFALSSAERTVAAEHAKSGGWFVASRVHRQFAGSGRSVPAPLAFRFATQHPVYPMRLTGAGTTRPLTVELVVFGPSRAVIPGLKTHAVAPLQYDDPDQSTGRRLQRQSPDSRRLNHPELVRWTRGSVVATRAQGELSVAQMQTDLPIQWTQDKSPSGLQSLSTGGAWWHAAMLAGAICFAGAVFLGFRFQYGSPPRLWAGAMTGVAVVGGLLLWLCTPSVATERSLHLWSQQNELNRVSQWTALQLTALPVTATDEAVQAAFKKTWSEPVPILENQPKLGDAPGEFILRKVSDGRWRVVQFDAYGQPCSLEYFAIKPDDTGSASAPR